MKIVNAKELCPICGQPLGWMWEEVEGPNGYSEFVCSRSCMEQMIEGWLDDGCYWWQEPDTGCWVIRC